MKKEMLCPCHSGKKYEECCAPYHEGKPADTALILMKSRYSAYALGKADYIMKTTHSKSPRVEKNKKEWKKKILEFGKNTKFDSLDILSFEDGEKVAYVTFFAGMKQAGHNASFKEKSRFEKVRGKWFYCEGEITNAQFFINRAQS